MKPSLALFAIVLLSLGPAACGETGRSTGSSFKTAAGSATTGEAAEGAHITTTASGLVYDGDDGRTRFFGHEATAPEARAITTLVRRYYAAAAREDGVAACPLIASLTAETIPEDYGGSPGLRGKTCATIMSKFFKRSHRELVGDSATLEVVGVRVEGDRALVLLRFNKAPEAVHFALHREAGAWRAWELFAQHMP